MREAVLGLLIVLSGCQNGAEQELKIPAGTTIFFQQGEHDFYQLQPGKKPTKRSENTFLYSAKPSGDLFYGMQENRLVELSKAGFKVLGPQKRFKGIQWYPQLRKQQDYLLFESNTQSFRDIYRLSLKTNKIVRLTNNSQGNFDASWSPDGSKIVFSSSRNGKLELFTMNADGSKQTRLTQHLGGAIKAKFSPDGNRLVYISSRDGGDDLYMLGVEGGMPTKLTSLRCGILKFAMHPRLPQLAFSCHVGINKSSVYSLKLTGKDTPVKLTPKNASDAEPAYSPEGKYLAVARRIGEKSDIWIMETGGKKATRLTSIGSAWLPQWLPAGAGSI